MVKAKEFVAVWHLIRIPWLQQIHTTRKPPEFATRRAWKSFAVGVFSTSTVRPGDPTTIARIKFAEYLHFKNLVSIPKGRFHFLKDETPGTIDEKVPIQMIQDTIRELADINFFYDMFEVEHRRTFDGPAEIETRMASALSTFSLSLPAKIPQSTPAKHAAWLAGVRDFIRPWTRTPPQSFELQLGNPPTPPQVDALERAVAHVYCSTVTHVLRRRPVVPYY